MRIAGGEFGGRTLVVPKSDAIRPTQDRVREALFSILQCEIPGAAFLDLFAGTGSVGLEAISRGAASATFAPGSRGISRPHTPQNFGMSGSTYFASQYTHVALRRTFNSGEASGFRGVPQSRQ